MKRPSFYLCTYAPLAITPQGRLAAAREALPPLIDGSIRREPDLQHAMPAITGLCRGKQFAPRLCAGDTVAYITRKHGYHIRRRHIRLTAVLRVVEVLSSHKEGAAWYTEHGMPLPSNCMVPGNSAAPLSLSHRLSPKTSCGKASHREWDAGYKARSRACGTFCICKPLFVNLEYTAPEVTDPIIEKVFWTLPGTQNPGKQPVERGQELLDELGIDVKL